MIDKVDVNGYDIRFHLTRSYAPFFANVLSWLIILPKHVWQDIPEKVGVKNPGEYQNRQPIGSGPFIFGHWRKGQEVYFKANKDHYMAPKVDDVYLVIIPSVDGNAGALERGEIDMIQQTITPALADQLSKILILRSDMLRAMASTKCGRTCARRPSAMSTSARRSIMPGIVGR